MFKFLKEKLGSFFKKSSKEIAEKSKEEREISKKEEEEPKIKGIEESRDEIAEKEEEIGKRAEAAEDVKKEGFFARLKKRYAFKISSEAFSEFWEGLETLLLESNVALEVVEKIKQSLEKGLVGMEIEKNKVEETIKDGLKKAVTELMIQPFDLAEKIKSSSKPYVIVFFGVNGSGKTTTIAKLAHYLQKNKISCVLSASDTFRAAAIEQIEKHGSNLGIKVVKHGYGADSAAVAFDAISYAKSHNIDAVLVDTAGRMHTQANLMREMEKICKVTKPDLKIFIGEAIVGNDMLEQAKNFAENIGIDAMILSKADVDEKGGAAISASYVTKKPILFLGVGQEYDNLEIFDKEKIAEKLGL